MADYSNLTSQILNEISSDKIVQNSVNNFKRKYKYGTLKYTDASDMAVGLAKATSKGLTKHVVESDLAQYAEEVVAPVYRNVQKTALNAGKQVQKLINTKANIGLNPAEIEIDESRIMHMVERLKEASSLDDVSFLLGEDVAENVIKSAINDTIHGNAQKFESVGFETYVTRSDGSGCCDWCASMVGTYKVNDIPSDFWRVHKGCSCQFDYKVNGKHNRISFSTGSDGSMTKNTESI